MATYDAQRAGAGLLNSEGAQIEPRRQGYAWTSGLYSGAQVAGWRRVTDAVHGQGDIIFAQLWHVGRVSHTELQPDGASPVAPSAVSSQAATRESGARRWSRAALPTWSPSAVRSSPIRTCPSAYGTAGRSMRSTRPRSTAAELPG